MVENLPSNAGDARDAGWIPGSGVSPGEGNGNPLQYSCLENPMDRGAWWVTGHGVVLNTLGYMHSWLQDPILMAGSPRTQTWAVGSHMRCLSRRGTRVNGGLKRWRVLFNICWSLGGVQYIWVHQICGYSRSAMNMEEIKQRHAY